MGAEKELPTEFEVDTLNQFALERVDQYRKLQIGNFEIPTPFFSNDTASLFAQMMTDSSIPKEDIEKVFEIYNNNRVSFGWYRGKGTPEQITFAAEEIAKKWDLDLSKAARPEVIVEFMKSAGLGIDCSGLVYQTLRYSFGKAGWPSVLDNALEWEDSSWVGNEYKTGINNFTGEASIAIQPEDVRPLDIIVLKNSTREKYSHIALVLEMNEQLVVAHSVIGQIPSGVHISSMRIENGFPYFGFRPNLTERWEELYNKERLEFRRLRLNKKSH
ncbi:MAG: hypothetical protein ABIC57_03250 [bacterium]